MEKDGSFSVGMSREFLAGLPVVQSKAMQLVLLPLALYVDYKRVGNNFSFSISKEEVVDKLCWPKSYAVDGDFNRLVFRLVSDIAKIKINGIRVITAINVEQKGIFEIEYNEIAIEKYFEGLKKNYFKVELSTLQAMKNRGTWEFVRQLILYYDYSTTKYQIFARHTKNIKEMLELDIDAYVVSTTGKFDRPNFERVRLNPVIDDLLSMEQIILYPTKIKDLKKSYLGKSYKDGVRKDGTCERLVDNYFLSYKVNNKK